MHLARKYAWMFVRRQYLFREANSLCELQGTDNVQGQISDEGYCLHFIILQIFLTTCAVLKIGEYSWIFPSYGWGIFSHVMLLDQSRASEKDLMDYSGS